MGYAADRRKELGTNTDATLSYTQRRKKELGLNSNDTVSYTQRRRKEIGAENLAAAERLKYKDAYIAMKDQKLKDLNTADSVEQEVSTAIKNVEDRPKYLPKSIAQIVQGAKLSPEARVKFAEINSNEQAKTPTATFANKMIDSTTLGLYSTLEKGQAKKFGTKGEELLKLKEDAAKDHPVAATLGTVAGYIAPGAAAEKIAGKALAPILGNVGSKVAQKAISGAATGGGMELVEGLIRGENPEDIANRTVIGAGTGAVGDVALYGLGKGVSKVFGKLKDGKTLTKAETQLIKGLDDATELPKQHTSEVNPMSQALQPEAKTVLKSATEPYNINTLDNAKLKQLASEQGVNPNQTKSQLRNALKQVQPDAKTEPLIEPTIPKTEEKIIKQPLSTLESTSTSEVKERGFSKNIRTDMNRPDAERAIFDKDPEFYKTLSNKTTLESAQNRFSVGYENALKDFDATKGNFRADNVPFAKLIADEAVRRGDITTARRVLVDISETLTNAGQVSQAAKILRESNDPSAVLDYINRELNKLNTQGVNRYGKRWSTIDLNEEELAKIKTMDGAITDEQKELLFNELGESISARVPTTVREKFDAWRRMAMLFNPKTHVRNVAGNGLMSGLTKVSDTIATTIEKGLKPELRTKSLIVKPEFKDIASSYWDANKKALTEGSRWEIFGVKSPFADKRIFKSGWLETWNNASKKTLEFEDNVFSKKQFTDSLAGFMQARGLKEPTEEAVEYATRRSQEATFKEANELANFIGKAKSNKKFGLLVEAAVPFQKTPANILTEGARYSPIGVVQSAIQLINKEAPAKVIETFSKGLTGSGLTMLGYYMAKNGFARGQYENSKKVEGLMQASGELPNSIITPKGSYTIDWAQPASMPFFMGVGMAEALKEDGVDYVDAGWKALLAGGDSLIEQSMLKGVMDLFGGYGSTTEKFMQLPVNYLQQAFPTALGQAARIIDPLKRQADYSTNTSRTLTGLQSKTPGLSGQLPLKRDLLGQPQKYGEGVLNVIQQFISPGYIAKKSDDPIVSELNRLYETEGSEFLPRASVLKFTKDKIDYKLTNEEISEFQRTMGEYTKDKLTSLIQSSSYKSMSDTDKAKAIKSINDDGYELAKKQIIDLRKK